MSWIHRRAISGKSRPVGYTTKLISPSQDKAVGSGRMALYLVVKFFHLFRFTESKTCLSNKTMQFLSRLSGQICHPDIHRAVKTTGCE